MAMTCVKPKAGLRGSRDVRFGSEANLSTDTGSNYQRQGLPRFIGHHVVHPSYRDWTHLMIYIPI